MNDIKTDPLAGHLKRKVRIVARETGPHSERLFSEAANGRKEWTPEDWAAVLAALDSCELPVSAWRALT